MTDTSSSAWRTAYVAAIFETEPTKMALRIADARAAITERLNSPIEITRLEHEAIEAARLKLATLKAKPVEVVKLALVAGAHQLKFGPALFLPVIPKDSTIRRNLHRSCCGGYRACFEALAGQFGPFSGTALLSSPTTMTAVLLAGADWPVRNGPDILA